MRAATIPGGCVVKPDVARVRLDDRLADRQAQAAATRGAPGFVVCPTVKAFEDVFSLLGADARPRITDLYLHQTGVGLRIALHRKPDGTAGRRVAQGVIQQVAHHLPEPCLVAHHQHGPRRHLHREGDAALARQEVKGLRGLAANVVELDQLMLQGQVPGVGAS